MEKGVQTVQDFMFLDKTAYGPFSDAKSGTTINLTLDKDPDGQGNRLALFRYLLKTNGWGGYWMRVGDVWGGQDWTGAKALVLEVSGGEPLQFQIGFNDANQNAFVAETPETKGRGWEKIVVPFDRFQLNPYYQPPEAKKGSPRDLSHVESFNIAPLTPGKHEFRLRKITVEE